MERKWMRIISRPDQYGVRNEKLGFKRNSAPAVLPSPDRLHIQADHCSCGLVHMWIVSLREVVVILVHGSSPVVATEITKAARQAQRPQRSEIIRGAVVQHPIA